MQTNRNLSVRAFLMGDFCFEVTRLLCVQVRWCPVKRGNRTGSSRNEFAYSRRGTQAIFPLLDCRSCEKFGLAHSFNFLTRKKNLTKWSPYFDRLSVL